MSDRKVVELTREDRLRVVARAMDPVAWDSYEVNGQQVPHPIMLVEAHRFLEALEADGKWAVLPIGAGWKL